MPSYIVKPEKGVDCYVWWSDIVEAPHAVGTRAEVEACIRDWSDRPEKEAAPERFTRADRTGTSAMWPNEQKPAYGWADGGGFIAEQKGYLPRHLLRAYAELYCADDTAAAYALLEPFEDDSPVADSSSASDSGSTP